MPDANEYSGNMYWGNMADVPGTRWISVFCGGRGKPGIREAQADLARRVGEMLAPFADELAALEQEVREQAEDRP